MKKLGAFLFLLLTTVTAVGQSVKFDTIQYAKKHHQNRLELFKSEPVTKGKIIFLGNSITEFGDWKKLLNNNTVVNRGIAGDNTFGILNRLDDVIKLEPGKLFIKIGINDISQNIPEEIIIKNISTIIERVKANSPKTKIYLSSILPTNDNTKNDFPAAYNKNHIVIAVNKQLFQLAKKQGIDYINLYALFKDKQGKLNAKYADADGLHLNDLGYKTWVEFLKTKKYL
ncbi:GDSL-type esterase/lipase family protein [Flavobacterium pedocola]